MLKYLDSNCYSYQYFEMCFCSYPEPLDPIMVRTAGCSWNLQKLKSSIQ